MKSHSMMKIPTTFCCLLILLAPFGCGSLAQTTDAKSKAALSNKLQFKLDNGLDVTLLPTSTAKTTALIVLYDVGNRFDPPGKSGLSHMAEHLYVTAATENNAARDVRKFMTDYPDGSNAQTGDDYTVIATVFKPGQLNNELADAADRMAKIRVEQSDLDRELPRMELELRNMYSGMPMLAVANQGRQLRSPLPNDGRRGGKVEELKKVSVEEIQSWLDEHYKPGNARLILVGAFDKDEVKTLIKEKFSPIAKGTPPLDFEMPTPSDKTAHSITLESLGMPATTRVGYTYRAPKHDDPLYVAFTVHAFQLQMQSMRGAKGGPMANRAAPPFMLRPLDDPDFFYASVDVADGETEEEAFARLDELLNKQLSSKLKKHQVTTTESNLARFLATKELPPQMLAMNPYGTAFSEGRRQQLGMDSAKLKIQFAELTQAQMDEAAKKYLGKANRVSIKARPSSDK